MAQQIHPKVEAMIEGFDSSKTVDLVFVCEDNRAEDVSRAIEELGDEVSSELPGDVVVATVTVENLPALVRPDYILSVSPDREARALA
ncbi:MULTISPECIES: hypothetical protein [Haloferax]|uniref:Uncharacterized protein n=2 Tax=Haloferax sulfurifontis TaxID=255616 RepID=A0A830DVE9_9EURY|nr:hypothetical protein [Haloferax sulfurifontis]GGC53374.1 hypothetical protein GCM10007209_13830 [Haloferax sulfurifontis]